MSRYIRLDCPAMSLAQLHAQLDTMEIPHLKAGRRRLMLTGSLECGGEPVDVRCEPGVAGSVEDFGFVLEAGQLRLVCGEVDRDLVESEVLNPLKQAVAHDSVLRAAQRAGLRVEGVTTDTKGRKRIVLKGR